MSHSASGIPVRPPTAAKGAQTRPEFKVAALEVVRIGDVVPHWTLPRVISNTIQTPSTVQTSTLQTTWNNHDSLGWHSLALVVAGRNFALSWLPVWKDASTNLAAKNLETALVISSDQAASLKAPSATPFPILEDSKGVTGKLFGLTSSTSALVLIDRAGILRRVQPLYTARDLQTAFSQLQDPTPAIAEGQAAPDFRVRDMNGNTRRLSDYRGRKNLLLTFFPKCFTGGCTVHLSSLRDEYSKLQAADVEVLAVSVDAADGEHGQKAFAKHLNLPFDLVPDTGRNLSILYGAANSPDQLAARISVLIDKKGVVRWIDKQINLKTHGADVLAKVQELGLAGTATSSSH